MGHRKRGRGHPRKYERQPGGKLIPNPEYRDRRLGKRRRKEEKLEKVDDSDPGAEGVNVVDE